MLIDTAMDLKMGLIKVVMGDFVSIYISLQTILAIQKINILLFFFRIIIEMNWWPPLMRNFYNFPIIWDAKSS